MKRFLLPIACGLALVLCGCPAQKPAKTAGVSKQATAPTLKTPAQMEQASTPEVQSGGAVSAETAKRNQAQQDTTLIAAAKQAYADGVTLYGAGQYQEARADFDRAVDIFLTSGRDLKSDAKLNDAFNNTVDAINSLEMESLQENNGFSEQDQAPVEVANEVTFPVDPNLLAKARADLKFTRSDLPLVVNDYVASYINYFTNTRKGHNTLVNSLAREGRYRAMVEKTLTDAGVPKDLIYLAIAESGFRPRAVNPRSGAGGMWQFMPYGDYGLVRNQWIDQRFDPVKSTEAYARYIKELHAQFGDWYLAMAAYDWGAGKVQRAVQKTGYADFWQLYQRNVLPAETKNYVPIILAAAIMAKNPTQYGLTDIPTDPPMQTDSVQTDSAINLFLVADLVGSTPSEIEQLNPALLRMSTPAGMTYDLHLPKGTGTLFEQRLAAIPAQHRDAWRYHIVTADDTVGSIAQTYHVKTAELEQANNLQVGNALQVGEGLAIPVRPKVVSRNRRYRVRRGDTIVTLADRFGVTTAQLRRWNRIRGNRVRAGRLIYVAEPVRTHRYSSRRHRQSRRSKKATSSRRRKTTRKSVHRHSSEETADRKVAEKRTTQRRHKKKPS